jgi:hypothetical protein
MALRRNKRRWQSGGISGFCFAAARAVSGCFSTRDDLPCGFLADVIFQNVEIRSVMI